MIQRMLDMQKNLMEALTLDYLVDSPLHSRLDTVNYLLTCISNEVEEVRKELPWKKWKNYDSYQPMTHKIVDETIDIFHFLLEIWLMMDIDGDGIYHVYCKKYKENLKRWLKDGKITEAQYHDAVECRKYI